jgi:protease I
MASQEERELATKLGDVRDSAKRRVRHEKDLHGKRIAFLLTDGFEEVELTQPRKALDEAGAKTEIVSPAKGEIQGMNHIDKGDKFKVDIALDKADPRDFDALVLPGGVMNADELRTYPDAVSFVSLLRPG